MADDDPVMASGRIAIGVDVGGSGIKAAVVDVDEQTGRARAIDRMLLTENDIRGL